jgi:alkaline phosphatase D
VASPFVSGAWSGNVTASSATVCIRLTTPGLTVRAAAAPTGKTSPPIFSPAATTNAAGGNTVSLNMTGLLADTDYDYSIEVGGVVRTEPASQGHFHTFPSGAASFKIALAGDSDFRDPDQSAFDAIVAEKPLLILFNGDLHYSDIKTTNPDDYRAAYDSVLKQPSEGAMFRSAALAYVWDDHDSAGGDNTNGTAIGMPATRAVYSQYVPHYPLAVGDGTIGQSFTVGRVRVIMTDLRSASVPSTLPESPTKSRMGAAQKAWFKQELLNARNGSFPLILWVSSVPWISAPAVGDDSWAGYATERTEIANFIRDNGIKNLVVFAGDMHALAYDDGTHSDYATGGGSPLVLFHSAAMTRPENIKGGPYTAGPLPGSPQYGTLEITDTGGPTLQALFTGKRAGLGTELVLQITASTAGISTVATPVSDDGTGRSLINISSRGRLTRQGDALIAGFVIGGRTPRNILVRAVGPSLTQFGVTDAVTRPVVTLYSGATVIASNSDWSVNNVQQLTTAFDLAGAFRFASATNRDAALEIALLPGAYTLQATSLDGGSGTVLAEAYEVP